MTYPHVRHTRRVPLGNVLVERGAVSEQICHARDARHIPLSNGKPVPCPPTHFRGTTGNVGIWIAKQNARARHPHQKINIM